MQPRPYSLVFTLLLLVGCSCNLAETMTTAATGGAAGGAGASGGSGSTAGGAAGSTATSDAAGAGGSTRAPPGTVVDPSMFPVPPPLEPTVDCVHPPVVAACTGEFCRIPAGCFIMGAPRSEGCIAKNADQQVQVRLTHDFLMARTELTQAQWDAAGLPKSKRARTSGGGPPCVGPECPVGWLTFFDALTYLNERSRRDGLPPCYELGGCVGTVGDTLECQSVRTVGPSLYACEGYRLPMEAEWEYAARAGAKTGFYTGPAEEPACHECAGPEHLAPAAWYCGTGDNHAHAVGLKAPNGWGLRDMMGNVFEFCNDAYTPSGYGTGPLTDPLFGLDGIDLDPPNHVSYGPVGTQPRIGRGGNYLAEPMDVKIDFRFYWPTLTASQVADTSLLTGDSSGLRIARTAPATKP